MWEEAVRVEGLGFRVQGFDQGLGLRVQWVRGVGERGDEDVVHARLVAVALARSRALSLIHPHTGDEDDGSTRALSPSFSLSPSLSSLTHAPTHR